MANPNSPRAFSVVCPNCRKTIRIPKSMLGRSGNCPSCGNKITISSGGSQSSHVPATALAPASGAPTSGDVQRIREISKAQRLVNISILLYFLMIPMNIALRVFVDGSMQRDLPIVIIPVILCVLGFILFAVGKLAYALNDQLSAFLHCLAMFIPIVGLVLLLLLNSKATNELKRHGVKIGILGAIPNTVP